MNLTGPLVRESMHLEPNVITSGRNTPKLRIPVAMRDMISNPKWPDRCIQPIDRLSVGK